MFTDFNGGILDAVHTKAVLDFLAPAGSAIVTISVNSVEDLVSKALAELGKYPDAYLGEIGINGHGAPGLQAVGCGKTYDHSGITSLQVDGVSGKLKGKAAEALGRLTGKFDTEYAVLTLYGCMVARSMGMVDGKEMLRAVSKALGGVRVQAGDELQWPIVPGMEGNVWECVGDTCRILRKTML